MGLHFYIQNSKMEEFIKVPKFYMTLMAVWPLGKEKFAFFYYLHCFIFSWLLSVVFVATLAIDVYVNRKDLAEIIDAAYFFVTVLTFLIKFILFSTKRKEFLYLLDQLESDVFNSYTNEQKRFLHAWSKIACAYSNGFFMSCLLCLVFFGLFPVIDKDESIILPFRGWFPFDVKENLVNRGLVYVFQLVGLLVAIFINASIDVLPSIFMNVACSQMEILKENLESSTIIAEEKIPSTTHNSRRLFNDVRLSEETYAELLSDEQDFYVNKTLKNCVKHHEAILAFLQNVENLFTMGMFAQFIDSSLTICITGFQLIVIPGRSIKFVSVIAYLLAKLFQISCYCWNGHEVAEQTSSVAESCYKMEWYRCSNKVKKSIFIVMERCKLPVIMTAGSFFILSIVTLTAVLKTSYTYFAVLRKVYSD